MALNPSTVSGRFLKFESAALPPHTLALVSYDGREAISKPYRFEVELVSDRADLDLIAVLQQPALIGIKQGIPISGGAGRGIRTLSIHGVLATFEQGRKMAEWVEYRAALVPKLWQLTLNVQTRIFMEKKVPEIVEAVLKGNGFTGLDYEFRMDAGTYPPQEYVVQYQESDLNFISRLLEHVGGFYYFLQGEEREKVVFGDSPKSYEAMSAPDTLPYHPAGERGVGSEVVAWFDPERVRSLTVRSHRIPNQVILRDYNWRTPSVDLKVDSPVVPHGYGIVYEYGTHYKDTQQGKALAQVRAEELKCRQLQFVGTGDCRSLHPGMSYQLKDHYRAEFNQPYLITEIRHRAEQAIVLGGTGSANANYANDFVSIPAKEAFRPERLTPKPRIPGPLNAKVDAAGSGQYAEIDDQGQYKIQIPFDLSGKTGGQASRYVRMAQPYAGSGMGMHFPLHKGTEVALLHVNGDPDRPYISGALTNPETASPVIGGNQTQCVIRTGGDNKLVIDDDVGRITLSTPTANTLIRLGEHSSPDIGMWFTTAGHWISEVTQDLGMTVTGSKREEVKGGYSKEQVHGMKNIWIGGLKLETIVGSETKQIIGMENKTNVGVKNEFTLAIGLKMGASALIKKGPLEKDLVEVSKKVYGTSKTFVGNQANKIGTWTTETAGKMKQIAGDTSARFGKWKTDVAGPWVTKTANATVKTAKASWDASADWTVKAGGTVKQKASKLKTDVSTALVKAGGNIKLVGGGLAVKISAGVAKIGKKLKVLG